MVKSQYFCAEKFGLVFFLDTMMSRVIKVAITIIVLMFSALNVAAAEGIQEGSTDDAYADSVVVSLVTCYPGPDVYEVYGHMMLRVRYHEYDRVYNYGTFDFDADNFVYHFVKGETDYRLTAYDGSYILYGYHRRKVVEQRLNLTVEQSMAILLALSDNLRPENAVYRYSFVYDNCATRPRDIVESVLNGNLHYGEMTDTVTFRQEIRRYTANYPWYQFGVDIVLGSGIDYELSYREQMFVPMVLMKAFDEATVERDGHLEPLVAETIILNDGSDEGDILPPTPVWLSPMAVMVTFLLVTLVISGLDVCRGRVSRGFDSLLFGITGLAGLLLFFLIFMSSHAGTSPNFNGFWIHPFALLPAILVWIKKSKKILYFYHFANFAVIVVLLVVWRVLPQEANAASFPLMMSLAVRSLSYILVYRKECKNAIINK